MKVVLLPGLDGTGLLSADFCNALRKCGHQPLVLAYPPTQCLNYSELEAYVRKRLPCSEPFVVLAESFSGPIGIRLAADSLDGMKGLILCCTFARSPLPLGKALAVCAGRLRSKWIPLWLISAFVLGRYASEKLNSQLKQALDSADEKVLVFRARQALCTDATEALPRIQIPVAYFLASDDRVVNAGCKALIQRKIAQLQVSEFVAPHFLLQVLPEEAALALDQFIKQISVA